MSEPPNSPSNKLGRRTFLATSCAGVAAGCLAGSFLHGCGTGGVPGAGLGAQDSGRSVADMPVGAFVATPGYILARDAAGFYAYSLVCTHSGCTLPSPGSAEGESVCPCHHARFDANGVNVAGPDGRGTLANLAHYQVTFVGAGEAARVFVNVDAVEPDIHTRAAPPAPADPDASTTAPDAATPPAATSTPAGGV